MKQRLDQQLVALGLVPTRSQAESYIKLGDVTVNGRAVTKPGTLVDDASKIALTAKEQYVSRAALKLASVAETLGVSFAGAVVLDVGSSTGGFTDFALRRGAVKSIAVEIGTNQLHPSLHGDPRIELHEQTDIRDCYVEGSEAAHRSHGNAKAAQSASASSGDEQSGKKQRVCVISERPDIVVADVSFISLREILPHVATLCKPDTRIVAMVKPQFEAEKSAYKHKGVIKNDRMRRDILKDFESWASGHFVILDKADSHVSGSRGNVERFYLLRILQKSKR